MSCPRVCRDNIDIHNTCSGAIYIHPPQFLRSLALLLSLSLGTHVGHNITDVDNATFAAQQMRIVVVGNGDNDYIISLQGQGHQLLNADSVSVFERQHIIPAAVEAKVCAVLVVNFLVHVGHDLSRLSECTDHLILPLVDQHPVLQDNTRVSVITQAQGM